VDNALGGAQEDVDCPETVVRRSNSDIVVAIFVEIVKSRYGKAEPATSRILHTHVESRSEVMSHSNRATFSISKFVLVIVRH